MKSATYLKCFGAAVVALGLAAVPALSQAQEDPAQAQPSRTQAAPTSPDQGMPQEQQVKTFTGTIVKAKGELVLKDASTKAKYKLDNAGQVKQYQGKNVKVTGTLDTATNTIHVSNVELASAAY